MIQLSDEYRLINDPLNVILERKMAIGTPEDKKKNNPRKEWKEVAYFSSIKNAFKHFIKLEIKESSSLSDLVIRLEKFEEKVDELFKQINLSRNLS
jgi:hypothetical protein